jgi:hypothetical protein
MNKPSFTDWIRKQTDRPDDVGIFAKWMRTQFTVPTSGEQCMQEWRTFVEGQKRDDLSRRFARAEAEYTRLPTE